MMQGLTIVETIIVFYLFTFFFILQLVDGCYTINVTKEDVGYNRYTEWQWGVRLEIEARVKEQGTNVYLNATTQTLQFQQYDIKLEIEGADKFKPGLPYNGKVSNSAVNQCKNLLQSAKHSMIFIKLSC